LSQEDTKDKQILRDQIEDVELYLLDDKGIAVAFGQDENNSYGNKLITINTRQNLRYQLHTLLHEAGHALLRNNKKKYEKSFSMYSKRKSSKSYKLGVLKEEIMAWEQGYKLALKLGIVLNEGWWKKHSEKCIYDYVGWVVDGR